MNHELTHNIKYYNGLIIFLIRKLDIIMLEFSNN